MMAGSGGRMQRGCCLADMVERQLDLGGVVAAAKDWALGVSASSGDGAGALGDGPQECPTDPRREGHVVPAPRA